MSADWQAGDLALCVDAAGQAGCPIPTPLNLGQVYTVVGIDGEPDSWGEIGLFLAEVEVPSIKANGIWWAPGFAAYRFRKLRPDEHEACEPEFVTLLKRVNRTVRA